jgi:perosamine synthetase
MVFPRQRLYDVNHAGFAKAIFLRAINAPKHGDDDILACDRLRQVFSQYTGIDDIIPLSRGRLAVYFGVKHSISCKRRKVIMSPFTIFDIVNMVIAAGGEPNFVDIKPGSVHLSCRGVEEAIDESTAAVIVTHYHSTNREIEVIAEMCRAHGVKLIEDCAISLGARYDGQHVGTFGDFALFSFGLFKFVSTYFGGGMVVRAPDVRAAVEAELATWPHMSARDLAPYAVKGLKLSALTNRIVFERFTFPLFRFGYQRNVQFIKRNAQNDPEPVLRKCLPVDLMRRASLFQLREFCRQLPLVEDDRRRRLANASHYYLNFDRMNIRGLPEKPDSSVDSYVNFPLLLEGNREWLVAELMKSGFDLSVYYYRNCATLTAFREYYKHLPNVSQLVSRVVSFPVYPGITSTYIDRLAAKVKELTCRPDFRRARS